MAEEIKDLRKEEDPKKSPAPSYGGNKGGKPHKGGKSKSKGKGKPTQFSNNLDWWNRYPALTKDVTNIAFNWLPGMKVELSDNLYGGANQDVTIPGVLSVKYTPTIGLCETDSDSYNAQMRELFIDMHRKYRGIGSYQKSDLGIAIFCITDLFSTLAWAERIYGVLNYYNIQNRNVPYTLLEALHIGSNIISNLAMYRYQLNLRILRAQQLCLPKGLTMLESRIIMNSAIFKDSENPRAALFFFEPSIFYTFDGTTISTGSAAIGKLLNQYQTSTTPSGLHAAYNMASIFNIIDAQLNALLNDDDVTKMCSDLIAAYGPENVTTLITVPEDYKVVPIYDEERQLQLHNLTVCGEVTGRYNNTVINTSDANTFLTNFEPVVIYQLDNVIRNDLSNGRYSGTYVNIGGYNECDTINMVKAENCLFDVWRDTPTDQDIMCGTRFTTLAEPRRTVSSKSYQRLSAYGFEVVNSLCMWLKSGATFSAVQLPVQCVAMGDYTEVELSHFTKFDWHPLLYVDDSTSCEVFGDLDNFCVMTTQNLTQIHTVAILSGSKLPMVGGSQVDTKQ